MKKIVYLLKRIDTLKSGGSSPALARLASVAGPAHFWDVKNPETVDAVGFQPTASILSAKLGQRRQNRSPRQVFDSVFASKTNPTVMLSSKMCIYF